MPDLSTRVGKLKLANPLVLCAGISGLNVNLWLKHAKEAGAVTIKSCSVQPRLGHANPTVVEIDKDIVLNAVGLSNPGAEYVAEEIIKYKSKCKTIPLIASLFGKKIEEFGETAAILDRAKPDIIEIDASCPNVEGVMFSNDTELIAKVTEAVRENTSLPVFVKLSAAVNDIVPIAKAAVAAGADGITAINTLPGMAIDPIARKPILTNKFGGVSGRAIKPMAVRAVYMIRKALPEVPIIGMGGVTYGTDVAEMIIAGANAVGVGTAVMYRKNAFATLKNELMEFMDENKYKNIGALKLNE
ncbi:dihydroorotate dehydrogenase [Candidatus Micrarchaeota archaeon CG08_land_8_20_14_0_20_49_17]|nr:MAG: hypothetical protein AUJ13_05450 [Candidatus Micrarchaeota archaeon CG1_02_49_24]PIU09975.1 MAG: dihydroorotate dehydrogenase [Candidatus Micrarchaeota archaeon CG08_land_8_20_14_0_20_49_17]PIU82496.1 MAG: dihydroorotate dehydrogenase [Candidatus Micrarchaeota archaeon CG06_land_8_20_14_3_00_50_6]PIZ95004.1 MAG: dihydroorotate dehydrogenase [Candidatus Micrarchaeota archaeon CG_4_10_14_0_2_um_filter_49_7]HII54410.1 dihydroorotate dehydrogenase [Candidatus Micrarchaeota archaeon]